MGRNDPVFLVNQAQQLLDNEMFQDAFNVVEAGIVKAIKQTKMDGSQESCERILEQVRSLQNLGAVKHTIMARITNHKLTSKGE